MGEIADMMINGEMCQSCGVFILDDDGHGVGYPSFCGGCQTEQGINEFGQKLEDEHHEPNCTTKDGKPIYRPGKTNCPQCNKLVKKAGLIHHIKTVHPVKKNG